MYIYVYILILSHLLSLFLRVMPEYRRQSTKTQ